MMQRLRSPYNLDSSCSGAGPIAAGRAHRQLHPAFRSHALTRICHGDVRATCNMPHADRHVRLGVTSAGSPAVSSSVCPFVSGIATNTSAAAATPQSAIDDAASPTEPNQTAR
jgi:hypothetical protein